MLRNYFLPFKGFFLNFITSFNDGLIIFQLLMLKRKHNCIEQTIQLRIVTQRIYVIITIVLYEEDSRLL